MAKVFKNTKQLLAFALAFAVLAVSLFTGINIDADASCDHDGYVVYYSGGYTVGVDNVMEGLGTETDPYIIETAENLRYISQFAGDASKGKYYKVADGIDAIVLQPKAKVDEKGGFDALKNLTSAQVNEWFSVDGWNNWHAASSGTNFQGTFDGNGVTVYGMSSSGDSLHALFSRVKGATIKNVAVKSSYVSTTNYGGIIAGIDNSWNNAVYDTIENCEIANCYVLSSSTKGVSEDKYQSAGVLGGLLAGNTTINNCLVYGNTAVHTDGTELAFIGKTQNNATMIKNSVVLGAYPYSAPKGNVAWGTCQPSFFSNIYTDKNTSNITWANYTTYPTTYAEENIKQIDPNNINGGAGKSAMVALDWSTVWFANGGAPALRVFHDLDASINEADKYAGHIEQCGDCGIQGISVVAHTYNNSSTCTACGYIKNAADIKCGSNVIYWNGTCEAINTASHAGTADDPYIIENAEQLAQLAMKTSAAASRGKYYKIADGIDAIVMQPTGGPEIIALDDADAVKAYFENGSPINWMKNHSWNQFNGNFDGNNVTIYGLYVESSSTHIGLFPDVDGGIGNGSTVVTDNIGNTIKNIAIRNSYYKATGKRVGAVVGHSYGPGYGDKVNGTISFENIIVANNYMTTTSTNNVDAGILGSNFDNEVVKASNILAYGNQTLTGNNVVFPMYGGAVGDRKDNTGAFIHNTITDSVVLGATPYNLYNFGYRMSTPDNFENVYTDAPAGEVTFNVYSNGNPYTATYAETDIKQIAATKGDALKTEVTGLDWENVWFAGENAPALRAYHSAFELVDNGDGTHSEACNCGVKAEPVAHDFDKSLGTAVCKDCGAICTHKYVDGVVIVEGDCVTDRVAGQVCDWCGDIGDDLTTVATGHDFEAVDAVEATCQSTGVIAHKYCSKCGNNFAPDAETFAPMSEALAEVVDPQKPCTPAIDSSNELIYGMNGANHWTICSECQNPITTVSHSGTYTVDGANGHSGTCEVCGYGDDEIVHHEFGDDAACDVCTWTCEEHVWDDGNNLQTGNCTTDDITDYTCEICHIVDNVVIAAPGHTFEFKEKVSETCVSAGTKAHQYCTTCEAVFAEDADVMSVESLNEADLVIKVNAKSHVFDVIPVVEANCLKSGSREYKQCKYCDIKVSSNNETLEITDADIIIQSGEHHLTMVPITPATATSHALNAHYVCNDCGVKFADSSAIKKVTDAELVLDDINVGEIVVDTGNKSPSTNDSAAVTPAVVVALCGVAFVFVCKARKA